MRRNFGKTLLLTLLICVLLLGTVSAASGLQNFRPIQEYTGQFRDVSARAWYAESVAQAYSYGLIQGRNATAFDPGGNLTVAECVTLAARLHSTYLNDGMVFKQGNPWYRVYADYALENGVLKKEQSNYTKKITRAAFAEILSNALPDAQLPEINDVPEGSIPDVTKKLAQHDAVYKLYRAGILTGSDQFGTFLPSSQIKRSEAAAILIRMAVPEQRKSLALSTEVTVYSASGAMDIIPATQLPMYLADGWYSEPVTTVYCFNGATKVIPNSKVESFLKGSPDWGAEPFAPIPSNIRKLNKTQTSIPVVSVSTDGVEVLSKENYVNCSVSLSNVPQSEVLSGVTGGIRLRGNASSFYGNVSQIRANPVPYRLKLDSKVNFCGLNDGLKAKSWVLLTNLDAETDVVKNDIAFRLGRMLLEPDGAYCSDAQMVHLYLNGKFMGTYLLCEQNQVNKGRVQVNEPEDGYTGTDVGYFVELDGYYEPPTFTMNYDGATVTDVNGVTRTFRPNGYSIKNDVFSKAQEDFIAKYIRGVFSIVYQACEKGNYLTFDKNYNLVHSDFTSAKQAIGAVADLRSMADMYILYELMCDYDVGESSFYMCVDFSEDSKFPKLTFTAPWDFNWTCQGNTKGVYAGAFRSENFVQRSEDRSNPWFILLYRQKWFREMVKERWQELGGLEAVTELVNQEKQLIKVYQDDINSYTPEVTEGCLGDLEWILQRAAWLETQWG